MKTYASILIAALAFGSLAHAASYQRRFRCVALDGRHSVLSIYLLKNDVLTMGNYGDIATITFKGSDLTAVRNEPARLFTREFTSDTVALQQDMITGPHGGGYAEIFSQGHRWDAGCSEED